MGHPPGTVLVISGELTRYAAFLMSLQKLQTPDGTQAIWRSGLNIAHNLNSGVREMSGEWVWFMGDDHVFAPTILERLLNHEVDVVAPLCLRRKPPFSPVAYRSAQANGYFDPWPLADLPTRGLVEVVAVGGAGLLVRRRVIDMLADPWFEVGKTVSDELGEDLYFCAKARQAGFAIYIDVETPLGHIGPAAVWPTARPHGTWRVQVDFELGPDPEGSDTL